jgi:hypothetical protein
VEDREKLLIIQAVLKDVAGRESCYPDGDIADEIINRVRDLTGDASFCGSGTLSLETLMPKGLYEMRVTTWENDADDYMTKVIDNLTEADVVFYRDLCRKFYSRNKRPVPGYGNQEHSDQFYGELMDEMFAAHPNISAETKHFWLQHDDIEMSVSDRGNGYADTLIHTVLGWSEMGWGDGTFARVFDKFEVFTIVDNKRVEVTGQFN